VHFQEIMSVRCPQAKVRLTVYTDFIRAFILVKHPASLQAVVVQGFLPECVAVAVEDFSHGARFRNWF
jgi:hypothetical protein